MRIAQAAALSGLSPRQIRYYADRGVLPEAGRSAGRHRRFTDSDIRRLALLKTLLAADVSPDVACRVLDGRLTTPERRQIDGKLDRHLAAAQYARSQVGVGPASDDDSPDISLMFDIYVLRTRMSAVLTAALAESGVVAGEYALLSLLAEAGGLTVGEMARQLGAAPATLGRQLAELVRRGSLYRSADRRDRRRVLYGLTRSGERRYRSALLLAIGLAAELDRSLRQRGIEPNAARSGLQELSASLRALLPEADYERL